MKSNSFASNMQYVQLCTKCQQAILMAIQEAFKETPFFLKISFTLALGCCESFDPGARPMIFSATASPPGVCVLLLYNHIT